MIKLITILANSTKVTPNQHTLTKHNFPYKTYYQTTLPNFTPPKTPTQKFAPSPPAISQSDMRSNTAAPLPTRTIYFFAKRGTSPLTLTDGRSNRHLRLIWPSRRPFLPFSADAEEGAGGRLFNSAARTWRTLAKLLGRGVLNV